MASPFNDDEKEILRDIRSQEDSRLTYQQWADKDIATIKELESNLARVKKSLDRNNTSIAEYDAVLLKLRETLRGYLMEALVIPLEKKSGKANVQEDSLDALESRPSLEKSNAKHQARSKA